MAGRFDFQSPGAAFVDQMTKTLAQRKVEERQAMLDNLAKSADERAAQEAQQQALFRTDQMKTMAQQREIARVDALTSGLRGGASLEGMAPDDLKLLETYKRTKEIDPEPVPSVSTDETFNEIDDTGAKGAALEPDSVPQPVAAAPIVAPRPKRKVYIGSVEDQRKDERIAKGRAALGVLATSGDPEDLKAAEYLSLLSELNDGDIPKEAYSILTPKQRARIMNAETGEIRDASDVAGKPVMLKGDTMLTHNPYHPPDRGRQQWPVGKTRDGRTIYADERGNETIGTNQSGPDPGETELGIPVGLEEAHTNSLVGLMAAAGDPASADPVDLATFRRTGMAMIGRAKAMSQNVKQLARTALTDPANLDDAIRKVDLSPDEVQDLMALVATVIPPEAKAILLPNSPKRRTPPTPAVPVVKPQSSAAPNPVGNSALDRVTMRNWRPATQVTPQFDMSKDEAMKQMMNDAIFGRKD